MTIKDTIEERIVELQDKKRELANATIEGKAQAGKLTMQDMLALFRHDAEAAHDVGPGLRLDNERPKMLDRTREGNYDPRGMERVGTMGSVASGTSSTSQRGSLPPVQRAKKASMESQKKARSPQPEDNVYSRRW